MITPLHGKREWKSGKEINRQRPRWRKRRVEAAS